MFDMKAMTGALTQLEEERGIPKEKIIEAIELALAAAYKKDYGKKNQIIRAHFDITTGALQFEQVKKVVDESVLKGEDEEDEEETEGDSPAGEKKVRFNEDHHIMLADAKIMKKDAQVGDELVFPLDDKEDFGRIAAQTAKQVIIQRIREAERVSILGEYATKAGDIVQGKVQQMERGNVFVDLGRAVGILPYDEQIPGEHYRQGERIKAYLVRVEEGPRGVTLRLSRSHPQFITKLFEMEAPEIASGTVLITNVAREAGSRSKIAVKATDPHIDPVGSCVGQRGVRVSTVISELGGEKLDIIEWSPIPEQFISNALSPATASSIQLFPETNEAKVEVAADQFSLAIGRGGQNVRLAAKLTGWKIDISSPDMPKPEAVEAPAVAE
ncbi:MAG: transcription termination factor NusA [Candidatus Paceibacterota bacterium]|jgi:N utilization substance protein A